MIPDIENTVFSTVATALRAESPGVMYRCTRDSGIPLHNMPHELVGHYFEIVKEG